MTLDINVLHKTSKVNHLTPKNGNSDTEKPPLNLLLKLLFDYKAELTALKKVIASTELDIVSLCGHKPEGTTKFDADNFEVSTVGRINRRITNLKLLQALAPELVILKPSLNTPEFNSLARNNPQLFNKVSQCVESNPAKTSVSLKPKDEV